MKLKLHVVIKKKNKILKNYNDKKVIHTSILTYIYTNIKKRKDLHDILCVCLSGSLDVLYSQLLRKCSTRDFGIYDGSFSL